MIEIVTYGQKWKASVDVSVDYSRLVFICAYGHWASRKFGVEHPECVLIATKSFGVDDIPFSLGPVHNQIGSDTHYVRPLRSRSGGRRTGTIPQHVIAGFKAEDEWNFCSTERYQPLFWWGEWCATFGRMGYPEFNYTHLFKTE